jgi:hypothetical protein
MHERVFRPSKLTLIAVALVILAAAPIPAVASHRRALASSPTLSLSPTTARPGTRIRVIGRSFPKKVDVRLLWDADGSVLASVTTTNSGSFSGRFVVPDVPTGTYQISAIADEVTTADVGASAMLNVQGDSPPPPTATPTSAPPPTATPTSAPTKTPTSTATATATKTATKAATATATKTATKAATATQSPTRTPTANQGSSPSGASCQRLIVPIYPSNNTNWDQAVASGMPSGSLLILNLGGSSADDLSRSRGGPGLQANATMQQRVQAAHDHGYLVLGYVRTGGSQGSGAGARRDPAYVHTDVANLAAWYGVDGIYFDEVYASTDWLSYYQSVVDDARKTAGGLMVLNSGWPPDSRYMAIGDIVVDYEGSYSYYRDSFSLPSWVGDYPASRFAQEILDAATVSDMQNALTLSRNRNAGYIYVSNASASLANAYANLPSYWSAEVTASCS